MIVLVSVAETPDLIPLKTTFPEALYEPDAVKGGSVCLKKVEALELSHGQQLVQIALEDTFEIQGIWVWHKHQNMRAYVDDVEEITLDNSDHDNSSGLGLGRDLIYAERHRGRVMAGKGVKGRYVRLYSNGSTSNELNHYIEVEAWVQK